MMKIVVISGSLRAASLNSMMLRVLQRIAPEGFEIVIAQSIAKLPLFNPDCEYPNPEAVIIFREQIIAADAVIIASPEYAHGVSGAMKNALDWMVSNESFVNKPTALFNTSDRATHALAAIRETLVTMSANIVDEACVTIPLLSSGLDEKMVLAQPVFRTQLLDALNALKIKVD